jgi:hypothetical protein
MNESLTELGEELVKNALNEAEFSAQRGLINELFPYVYEASKRMSSRAISRWLESKGVKLSAATIAKALRNPKPYWQELAEEMEPAATEFSKAHNISVREVLLNETAFTHLRSQPPSVEGATRDGLMQSFNDIDGAGIKLADEWYTLPLAAREACLAYAELDLEEIEEPEDKTTVHEETK